MKFLDSTGLAHLWSKMKEYVGGQIGNIDRTLYKVITKLPDTSAEAAQLGCTDVNKIYLVSLGTGSPANQEYAEYLYRGTNFTTNYSKSNWEKLGSFRSTVDLSNYAKLDSENTFKASQKVNSGNKTVTVSATGISSSDNDANKVFATDGSIANISTVVDSNIISFTPTDSAVNFQYEDYGENSHSVQIPQATSAKAGVMSSQDKKNVDRLVSDTYPFGITSFVNNVNVTEKGNTVTPKFNWAYKNTDFNPIKSQRISGGNLGGPVDIPNGATTYSISSFTNTSTDSSTILTYTLVAIGGSTSKSANTYVVFVHRNYAGAVDASKTSLTESDVKALTNTAVINGKSRTVSIVQNNQKIAYCYPAYFGNLSSIKDGNGFEGFGGYTKSTVSVGGVTYNVYLQNIAATSTGSYTFA